MESSGRIGRSEGIIENIKRTRLSGGERPVDEAASRAAEVLKEPSASYFTSIFNYFGSRSVKDLSREELPVVVSGFLGISSLNDQTAKALSILLDDPDGKFGPQFQHFIELAGRVRNENLLRYVQGDPNPSESMDPQLKEEFNNQFSALMELVAENQDAFSSEGQFRLVNQTLFRMIQRANPNPKAILKLVGRELESQNVTEKGFTFGSDQRTGLERDKLPPSISSLVDQSYRYIEDSGDMWVKFSVEPVSYSTEERGPLNFVFHIGIAVGDAENPAEVLVPFDLSDMGTFTAADKTTILTVLTACLSMDESDLKEVVMENVIPDLSVEVNVKELVSQFVECHRNIRCRLGVAEILAGTPASQSEFKQKLDSTYQKERLQLFRDRVVSYLSEGSDLDRSEFEKLKALSQDPQTLFQLLHIGRKNIKEYLHSDISPSEHENIEPFLEQLSDYVERFQGDLWDILDLVFLTDMRELRGRQKEQLGMINNLYQGVFNVASPEPPEPKSIGTESRLIDQLADFLSYDREKVEALFVELGPFEDLSGMEEDEIIKSRETIASYLDECQICINTYAQKINLLSSGDLVQLSNSFQSHPEMSGLEVISKILSGNVEEKLDELKRRILASDPERRRFYKKVFHQIESNLVSRALQRSDFSQLDKELDLVMPYGLRNYIVSDYRLESISNLEEIRKSDPEAFVQYMVFVGACHQAFEQFSSIQSDPESLIQRFELLRQLTESNMDIDAFHSDALSIMRMRLNTLFDVCYKYYVYGSLRSGIANLDTSSYEKLNEMKGELLEFLDADYQDFNNMPELVSDFISQYHRAIIFHDEDSSIVSTEELFRTFQRVLEEVKKTDEIILQKLRERYLLSE